MEILILEIVLFTVCLTAFVDGLIEKHEKYDAFHQWAKNRTTKLWYDMSKCHFCMNFHLAMICYVVVMIFNKFEVLHLLTPFVVSGGLKLINYDSKRKGS